MHLLSDKPARTSGDEGGSGNSSCSGCYATGLGQRLPVRAEKEKLSLIPRGEGKGGALPLNHGQGKEDFRHHECAKCAYA